MHAQPPVGEQLQRLLGVRRPFRHLHIPQCVRGEEIAAAGRDPVGVRALEREVAPHDRTILVQERERTRDHARQVLPGSIVWHGPARPPIRGTATSGRIIVEQQARRGHGPHGEPAHSGEQRLRTFRFSDQTSAQQRHAERDSYIRARHHTRHVIHEQARDVRRNRLTGSRMQSRPVIQADAFEQGGRQQAARRLGHHAHAERDRHRTDSSGPFYGLTAVPLHQGGITQVEAIRAIMRITVHDTHLPSSTQPP